MISRFHSVLTNLRWLIGLC